MLSRMSHTQFDEWCAKDMIEPIGSEKICHTMARVGVLIAKFMDVDLKESDFMPWTAEQVRPDTSLTPKQSVIALGSHLASLMPGKQ